MARIAGINIPVNKHVWVGLTHIYGIGRTRALASCKAANVEPSTRVRDLTEPEVNALRAQVSRYMVEGDLRRENSMSLKRLMDLGAYRGIRHRKLWRHRTPVSMTLLFSAEATLPRRLRARSKATRAMRSISPVV